MKPRLDHSREYIQYLNSCTCLSTNRQGEKDQDRGGAGEKGEGEMEARSLISEATYVVER